MTHWLVHLSVLLAHGTPRKKKPVGITQLREAEHELDLGSWISRPIVFFLSSESRTNRKSSPSSSAKYSHSGAGRVAEPGLVSGLSMATLARSAKTSVGVALTSRAHQPHPSPQATVPIAPQCLWVSADHNDSKKTCRYLGGAARGGR